MVIAKVRNLKRRERKFAICLLPCAVTIRILTGWIRAEIGCFALTLVQFGHPLNSPAILSRPSLTLLVSYGLLCEADERLEQQRLLHRVMLGTTWRIAAQAAMSLCGHQVVATVIIMCLEAACRDPCDRFTASQACQGVNWRDR